jgi:glucose/arabinose dehydrogenase
MAFLPDGSIMIAEKLGEIRLFKGGKLLPAPIPGAPPSYKEGESGHHDLLLDPKFAQNGLVYISYSEGKMEANHAALWRARFDGKAFVEGRAIFRVSPDKSDADHFGGRMVFLPDETLLMTIGDGYKYRDQAQNLKSYLGKVVRLTRDGKAPKDNPYVGNKNALPEIYSYGHRNAQGLFIDPRDNSVWEHEHGPMGGDEINVLKPGANYGWPKFTYGIDYDGTIISGKQKAKDIEDPKVIWVPSIAPSGFSLYLGDKFPAWRGDFFVGALADKHLRRVRLTKNSLLEERLLVDLNTRIRDVRPGPDGLIYVLTDEENGRLLRLVPKR